MEFDIRPLLFVIALVSLLTIASTTSGTESTRQNLRKHIETLTENGPRMAGTEAENLATEYIAEKFRQYGLEVEINHFSVQNAYIYQRGYLSIKKPFKENVNFLPEIRSPNTKGVISGELIYSEKPSENIPLIRNQIVMIERKDFDKVQKVPLRALIVFAENSEAWTNVWPENSFDYPVVTIPSETAKKIIEESEESDVVVELKIDAKTEERTSSNVVGTLPGASEETIIVTSHHDSVLTPGANDGGTGIAVMLETARELSEKNLERTVKFVSFGAEEYGLLGSKKFASEIKSRDITGVINIGTISPGPPGELRIGPSDKSGKRPTPWLTEYIEQRAQKEDLKLGSKIFKEKYYSSHHSFLEEEIPATWIVWTSSRENRPFWPAHTLADNLSAVDETNLEKITQLSVSSVRKLSSENLEDWRWKYRFPERFSIFTVLSAMAIVLGLAVGSYLKYARGIKKEELFSKIIPTVLISIFIFYLVLLSGIIQAF